jgi:hypothetical protein
MMLIGALLITSKFAFWLGFFAILEYLQVGGISVFAISSLIVARRIPSAISLLYLPKIEAKFGSPKLLMTLGMMLGITSLYLSQHSVFQNLKPDSTTLYPILILYALLALGEGSYRPLLTKFALIRSKNDSQKTKLASLLNVSSMICVALSGIISANLSKKINPSYLLKIESVIFFFTAFAIWLTHNHFEQKKLNTATCPRAISDSMSVPRVNLTFPTNFRINYLSLGLLYALFALIFTQFPSNHFKEINLSSSHYFSLAAISCLLGGASYHAFRAKLNSNTATYLMGVLGVCLGLSKNPLLSLPCLCSLIVIYTLKKIDLENMLYKYSESKNAIRHLAHATLMEEIGFAISILTLSYIYTVLGIAATVFATILIYACLFINCKDPYLKELPIKWNTQNI